MEGVEEKMNDSKERTIFVQVKERPERKLIFLRGKKATNYWEYCEEVGCDVWGILSSIKDALYEPLGLWLPSKMRVLNTSEYIQGVEVPLDYVGIIPSGMEVIKLPACLMMEFHGEPYEAEEIGEAIESVTRSIKNYKPERFGYEWVLEDLPRFQLSPEPKRGYIEALPVRSISN